MARNNLADVTSETMCHGLRSRSTRLRDRGFEAHAVLFVCQMNFAPSGMVADEFALVREFSRPDDKLGGAHREVTFAAETMANDLITACPVLSTVWFTLAKLMPFWAVTLKALRPRPACVADAGLHPPRGVAAHVQYELHILAGLEGTEHLGVYRRGLIGSGVRAHACHLKQGPQDRHVFASTLHMLFSPIRTTDRTS